MRMSRNGKPAMVERLARHSLVIGIVAIVLALAFAVYTHAQGKTEVALQTTAIATQVYATTTTHSATQQAYLIQTQDAHVVSAVQQTVTSQLPMQGTQAANTFASTQIAIQATAIAEVHATQTAVQGTKTVRDQTTRQTQVAFAVQQTVAALPTPTPRPTPTPAKPKINVFIEGCTTGYDALLRRIGEVTNAYATVQNIGETDVSSVVITLKANDEDSQHPDRQKFVQYLPAGHQITLDLTTGTKLLSNTAIEVIVTTREGIVEKAARADCKEIDPDSLDSIARILRMVVRIPRISL